MWHGLAGLVVGLTLSASPAPGQQFDNFGEGTLPGFQLAPDGAQPSIEQGIGLPQDGSGITLDITGGQEGVTLEVSPGIGSSITSISQPETSQATRVTLRALDRMLGQPTDVQMGVGETVIFGRIAIHVFECRYPSDDPASDAYAHLEILDQQGNGLFDGWMIASSPALNALEHPRYDVWVLRCTKD
jgi:hypothetical protein